MLIFLFAGQPALAAVVGRQPAAEHHPARDRRRRLLGCSLTRLLRSSLLEVMANDYIRTARAKGLTDRLVVWRHGLKNAAIPVIAFLGIQVTSCSATP